ncbi:MAG TPA: isoprenylcysteine carboxylmethyltransferase family protein [Actinophytocola sp.]|uniref:methyltransferase family protein n=1 Tax=Actinophytocola sp. TaxID=1872138 RepID=UPI002DDCCDF8|nr:isoprenylcysteine carboxylmethyltransferase family protein [Actinophytocola sp.]HEV2777980.1 isoprenylcysteine carboxylmethyltransferase family protein [Actinophytocola sp.]
MRKVTAASGSALFFALAPTTVAGLVPWWLTGWRMRAAADWYLAVRVAGALVAVAGFAVLVAAFVRFVVEGAGTPAPVAPTEQLVVGGPYRYVRNPIYLALLAAILGQAMVLAQPVLVVYAAVAGAALVGFVLGYEQPYLAGRYGEQYARYRAAVPGWWPRLRPWRPESSPGGCAAPSSGAVDR